MKSSMLLVALALGSTAMLGNAAAASAPVSSAKPLIVHIKNYAFSPPTVTVKQGTTITFVNDDDDAHTVTSSAGAFDSKGMDTKDTWKFTFKKAGTFPYICALHPFMKGKIVVKAGK